MEKNQLKHCPFCDGTATVAEVTDYDGNIVWEVSCDDCPGAMNWSYETEDKAINAWNRRANDGK